MPAYQETLDYIYSLTDYSTLRSFRYSAETFDLARMRALMTALDRPQDSIPALHIAGTKGKGSTAALCASALACAGYRTGLYTSPHLQDFCERIRVDGELIPQDDLVEVVAAVRRATGSVPDLTTFELVTAAAFVYFARCRVDVGVFEVGLGGRLDATNVISPAVSVITALSYDHMHLLGTTLTEIAGEKAGIIKPGVPVVSAPQPPEAQALLARRAAECGAPFVLLGRDWHYAADWHTLREQSLRVWPARLAVADWPYGQSSPMGNRVGPDDRARPTPAQLELPLLGAHQAQNAAVAYVALQTLSQCGFQISDDAICAGFRRVDWPGRFEILSAAGPALVADCAHNGDSAHKLADALEDYFPGRRAILLFGASADKDVAAMFDALLPRVSRAVMTQAIHSRALDPAELVERAVAGGFAAEAVAPVADALRRAFALAKPDDVIVATGSLFVVAEVRAAWAALASDGRRGRLGASSAPAGSHASEPREQVGVTRHSGHAFHQASHEPRDRIRDGRTNG